MCSVGDRTIVVETNVSPTAAFAFVADPVNETKWNPSAVRAERLSQLPIGVGSTFKIVGEMVGRQMTVDVAVTEFDPPHRTSTHSTSGRMRFETTYIVEPARSGASVTMSVGIALDGLLQVVAPLIRAGFGRRLAGLVPRLKAAIEDSPAAGANDG